MNGPIRNVQSLSQAGMEAAIRSQQNAKTAKKQAKGFEAMAQQADQAAKSGLTPSPEAQQARVNVARLLEKAQRATARAKMAKNNAAALQQAATGIPALVQPVGQPQSGLPKVAGLADDVAGVATGVAQGVEAKAKSAARYMSSPFNPPSAVESALNRSTALRPADPTSTPKPQTVAPVRVVPAMGRPAPTPKPTSAATSQTAKPAASIQKASTTPVKTEPGAAAKPVAAEKFSYADMEKRFKELNLENRLKQGGSYGGQASDKRLLAYQNALAKYKSAPPETLEKNWKARYFFNRMTQDDLRGKVLDARKAGDKDTLAAASAAYQANVGGGRATKPAATTRSAKATPAPPTATASKTVLPASNEVSIDSSPSPTSRSAAEPAQHGASPMLRNTIDSLLHFMQKRKQLDLRAEPVAKTASVSAIDAAVAEATRPEHRVKQAVSDAGSRIATDVVDTGKAVVAALANAQRNQAAVKDAMGSAGQFATTSAKDAIGALTRFAGFGNVPAAHPDALAIAAVKNAMGTQDAGSQSILNKVGLGATNAVQATWDNTVGVPLAPRVGQASAREQDVIGRGITALRELKWKMEGLPATAKEVGANVSSALDDRIAERHVATTNRAKELLGLLGSGAKGQAKTAIGSLTRFAGFGGIPARPVRKAKPVREEELGSTKSQDSVDTAGVASGAYRTPAEKAYDARQDKVRDQRSGAAFKRYREEWYRKNQERYAKEALDRKTAIKAVQNAMKLEKPYWEPDRYWEKQIEQEKAQGAQSKQAPVTQTRKEEPRGVPAYLKKMEEREAKLLRSMGKGSRAAGVAGTGHELVEGLAKFQKQIASVERTQAGGGR